LSVADAFLAESSPGASCDSINSTLVLNGLAVVPDGFCAFAFAKGLSTPRGITVADNGDVLVLERGLAQVTVIWNVDSVTGKFSSAKLASAPGLNHAVIVHKGYLYASSDRAVFRWKYTPGQRSDLGASQQVINGIPVNGHVTRGLAFDDDGLLYVQCGSGSNVDSDASRAVIRRFDISNVPQPRGLSWTDGKIFAEGVRNEAGIRFDPQGRLWGVENGCDDLKRNDLGGDIHNENPSEEMNIFVEPGLFYGYPYCWSMYEGVNDSFVRGSQWAHPNFMNDGTHTDKWCQDQHNVILPVYNFDAHMAPLDLLFTEASDLRTDFPSPFSSGMYVSFHGSWDRQPPLGYRVDHVRFDSKGMPVSNTPFLQYVGPGATGPNWHRPVALASTKCAFGDCLLVTGDTTGIIIAIGYSR